jgi:hypothetical protein
LDNTTYKKLTPTQATIHINGLKQKLAQFMEHYKRKLDPADINFLNQTMELKILTPSSILQQKYTENPGRVSVSGSLLDGLGRLVDIILQPYAQSSNSTILSSAKLKDMLMNLPKLPSTARLFAADAVSMYTNIDSSHTSSVIHKFLQQHNTYSNPHECNAVMEGLELIMNSNIFQFGDTYWLQSNGTAVGVSQSCKYATLYFTYHEAKLLKNPELHFYKRYVHDVICIWIPITIHENLRWEDMNAYGKLRWKFSEQQSTVNYLDITIAIDSKGNPNTRLYENPDNLYLYLPANSAHPFSTLKGLIHRVVYRTLRLTSTREMHNKKNYKA